MALAKDMQRLGKKAARTAEKLGFSQDTPIGRAVLIYALEDTKFFAHMEVLHMRAQATRREFGRHAIRRAIHGELKTRKSLWEEYKLREARKGR
jgi:hypothetical protein